MGKLEEAQEILKALGLPPAQYNELAAYTLLALCQVKPDESWSTATSKSLTISNDIMLFVKQAYNKEYAPNSRESFRRQVLHQFIQAGIVDYNRDNPKLATNSSKNHYSIGDIALLAIKAFGTPMWKEAVREFIAISGELSKKYVKEREMNSIPVKLSNGKEILLSAGEHNVVQAAIVHEFCPRFVPDGIVVYLGDTADKNLYVDKEWLDRLSIPIDQHSKLPDVVIYDDKKGWLFLIEAVTSHGPVSPKRMIELEDFLKNSKVGKVYVSAFPDFKEFKKHTNDIAWETEVWLVEVPDHMIHFNGDKFLGPR
ncbi:MAG: BsuBI/PstI family type II restriction endonuclease [Bacteroidetes bacterium]|nr:BsuBI/PstI family type II restriction endonuclease [Bacteroidota bacterium]